MKSIFYYFINYEMQASTSRTDEVSQCCNVQDDQRAEHVSQHAYKMDRSPCSL